MRLVGKAEVGTVSMSLRLIILSTPASRRFLPHHGLTHPFPLQRPLQNTLHLQNGGVHMIEVVIQKVLDVCKPEDKPEVGAA